MTGGESNPGPALEFLQREIPSRVRGYFPDLSEDFSLQVLHGGRPRLRKHSLLFEFSVFDRSSGKTNGLFVKIPKSRSPESVRTIYETHVALHRFCTQLPAEFNIVRPLDFFPEIGAWATERVEGEELAGMLRRQGALAAGPTLVQGCGRFLRCWHVAQGQPAAESDYRPSFLSECGRHLARLAEVGIEGRKTSRILEGFQAGAERLKGAVPTCLTSKDFNVRNIVVRKNRIFLVEVTEPRDKAVYEDLAAFLVSLTMLFWRTPWMILGVRPSPVLASGFLEGYFGGPAPLDRVSLFCAKNLCGRWHSALESLSARVGGRHACLGTALRSGINRFFYRQVMAHLETAQRAC